MNINIKLFRIETQVHHVERILPTLDERSETIDHGVVQTCGLDRATVDIQKLVTARFAEQAFAADHPSRKHFPHAMIERVQITGGFFTEELTDPSSLIRRQQRILFFPIFLERPGIFGIGQRELLEHFHYMTVFGGGGAEEFTPCGHIVEQGSDADSSATFPLSRLGIGCGATIHTVTDAMLAVITFAEHFQT
ncbi:hypothetical protein BMS3Bbin04_00880 [bacterium BMS3Bbin04]|nr:hypothetical protein BMS3Bbin04_00880 [bacterium BMS3Bbin04]